MKSQVKLTIFAVVSVIMAVMLLVGSLPSQVWAQLRSEDRGAFKVCPCDLPAWITRDANFDCRAYCCGPGGKWAGAGSTMCQGQTNTGSELASELGAQLGSLIGEVLARAFSNKNVPRWGVKTADAFQALNCAAFLSMKAAALAERDDPQSLYDAQYFSERAEMAMEGAPLDFECPRVPSASFSDETAYRVGFIQHLVRLRVDLVRAERDLREKEEMETKARLDLERAKQRVKEPEDSSLAEALEALRKARVAHENASQALEAAKKEQTRLASRFQEIQTCATQAQDLSECWK